LNYYFAEFFVKIEVKVLMETIFQNFIGEKSGREVIE